MLNVQKKKGFESKDVNGPEVRKLIGQLMNGFEEFKSANNDRLDAVEKKAEDPLTDDKVDKMSEEIGDLQKQLTAILGTQTKAMDSMQTVIEDQKASSDEMQLAMKRPMFVDENEDGIDDAVQKSFKRKGIVSSEQIKAALKYREEVVQYIRKGDLPDLERKGLSVGSDPDGGYLTGEVIETAIDRIVTELSPLRGLATVKSIGQSTYSIPYNKGGFASGWVGETEARPETENGKLALRNYPTMELYSMPAATQSMLDDGVIDIESWIAEEVADTFAKQEGIAFVNGDGVAKPRGIMNQNFVADASWADGKVGFVKSGAATAITSDALINLVYAPKSAFRQNSSFLMNRLTMANVRKLKDGEGNYLWQPSIVNGQPPTLLGYNLFEDEEFEDVVAGAFPILFGDVKRSYVVVDRVGVRMLRDPFSNKPYVQFYTTKRVGGGVKNFESYKVLKVAA